jgi:hypothetical protein
MRHLALLLIIVVFTSLSSCKFFKEHKIFGRKKAALAELLEQQKKIRIADSLKLVQEHLLAIEKAKADSARLAEEQRLALASRYNIVVGAFITPEYARAWADEYRNRGYNPEIIPMEGGRFELVVAEAYENIGKAVHRLNQFQDTVQIDAWIYKKNQ